MELFTSVEKERSRDVWQHQTNIRLRNLSFACLYLSLCCSLSCLNHFLVICFQSVCLEFQVDVVRMIEHRVMKFDLKKYHVI